MLYNVRTSYSLLKSTLKIEDYVRQAKEYGYTSIGICDDSTLYGVLEFYKTCKKYDMQALIGIKADMPGVIQSDITYPVLFYAKNYKGFQELIKLSRALTSTTNESRDLWALVGEFRNVFMLTTGYESEIETYLNVEKEHLAAKVLNEWRYYLGEENIYLGVSVFPLNFLELDRLKYFSKQQSIKMLPNQLLNSLKREEAFTLKVLENIERNDTTSLKLDSYNMQGLSYLHTYSEFVSLYQEADCIECIENAEELNKEINIEIKTKQKLLPKFDTPNGQSSKSYLKELTETALIQKDLADKEEYQERLAYELDVIDRLGFSDYFLIVWDIVSYCRRSSIRTGPGRGSAAGSLVSYLLDITLVDPIEYGLLFERFLNPERNTMPDIDLDIADDKRDQVINYISKRFGYEQVAQISTFSTFGAKQSVRDVLRVLGYDTRTLKTWSDAIPGGSGLTLDSAYKNSDVLRNLVNNDSINQLIFDTARNIEGLPRNISVHAAGVVINEFAIEEVVPVLEREKQPLLTQWTMYDVEEVGLLKMDFLGNKNLRYLDEMLIILKKQGVEIDINEIPRDDEETIALFREGKTYGIFQFESPGIRRVLKEEVKPTTFEDIIAVNALYRPGPMKQIQSFARRKHGQEKIEYLHPKLEKILAPTYGIIVYQEQVMQICQELAGFSFGEADLLRRAMSKKDKGIMQEEEAHFINGAVNNGVEESVAKEVFNYILQFASYGFNRSHAVVYSTLAYQSAYLKVHYPQVFFQVMLNQRDSHFVSTNEYLKEAEETLGKIIGLDIKTSGFGFTISSSGSLQVGFSSVKGLRYDFIHEIINERQRNGEYTDITDFLRRMPNNLLKEEQVESLIKAGAFDSTGHNRNTLLYNLPVIMQSIKMSGNNIELLTALTPNIEEQKEMPLMQRLICERETLGFTTSTHPMEAYNKYIDNSDTYLRISKIKQASKNTKINTIAMIQDIRVIQTKKQEPMAFVEVTDSYDDISLVVFPRQFQKYNKLLQDYQILEISGKVDYSRRGEVQILVDHLQIAKRASALENKQKIECFIRVANYETYTNKKQALYDLVNEQPGIAGIIIYNAEEKQAYRLSNKYNISHSYNALERLKELFGDENVVFRESK